MKYFLNNFLKFFFSVIENGIYFLLGVLVKYFSEDVFIIVLQKEIIGLVILIFIDIMGIIFIFGQYKMGFIENINYCIIEFNQIIYRLNSIFYLFLSIFFLGYV